MHGQPRHNTRLHVRLPPSLLGMNAWMTSQPNATTCRYVCHRCVWLISLKLPMDVCTTRHWQTSGRPMQALDTCSVLLEIGYVITHKIIGTKRLRKEFQQFCNWKTPWNYALNEMNSAPGKELKIYLFWPLQVRKKCSGLRKK